MADYSWVMLNGHRFLPAGYSYSLSIAACFSESERRQCQEPAAETDISCGYQTTAHVLRERLHALGFTGSRAHNDLVTALAALADPATQNDLTGPVPDTAGFLAELHALLTGDLDAFDLASLPRLDRLHEVLDALRWEISDTRSLLRTLLDAGSGDMPVGLDLSELHVECTGLDPHAPIATDARREQLASVSQDAPVLVLTEGTTDARLLGAAMEMTHPHMLGFVNFMDIGLARPQGGVSALAKTVDTFIAAGVANRFVALADNDTAAHDALAKLKARRALPESCRVLHFPPLDFLASYPTVSAEGGAAVLADVNGAAGALEMYLGRDVLTGPTGLLAPVVWGSLLPAVGRRQGALSETDKKAVQRRFGKKLAAARRGQVTGREDWDGIRAIIDSVIRAFD